MTDSSSQTAGSSGDTKPANVQELVKAWRVSGRKAQVLESRLHQAVGVARRYRRDLLRLAAQNRTRKIQAEGLQAKVLELLERPAPEPPVQELPLIEEGDESVPAAFVRQLLQRLRESHQLIAELETLLEFREKQVHDLLARHSDDTPMAQDWRLVTLQRELTDARHRIRLLTQELTQKPPAEAVDDSSARIADLERQLGELMSQGDDALRQQLAARDQQIEQLQAQVQVRVEELKKAVSTIHAARDRIKALESELEVARQGANQDEAAELLNEVTALQDEIARLQEENENLAARRESAPAFEQRIRELETENAQLKASADGQRTAKLEAALMDFRQKLQLAGAKYQEVKAALIEKHQQLVEIQGRSQESEKRGEFLEPLVRTLESALEDTRRQNAVLQRQVDDQKKRLESAASGAPAVEPSEALASMENKLKEARRSAVRAQAEAGMKRKEVAKLQEELEALRAKVVALGGTL